MAASDVGRLSWLARKIAAHLAQRCEQNMAVFVINAAQGLFQHLFPQGAKLTQERARFRRQK